jgi:outer membrane protein assembly factor BamB
MTDFVSVPSSFITTFTTLTPYFEVAESGGGVGGGLGCVSNGTNVACSYKTSTNYPHALVYYNADGSVKWKSAAGDLDFNTWGSAPLIQADGSVIIGDEINIIKYNSDGTKDWTVGPPPGSGPPVSLVTTHQGSIVSATRLVSGNPSITSTPVALYSTTSGGGEELKASLVLPGPGNSFYQTFNTPCVNNGTHPHRVYVSTQLNSDPTQGALWALEIDIRNASSPITPVWSAPFTFVGPSGASPLCAGDKVYFDGAGYGSTNETTVFGIEDTAAAIGDSPTLLFHKGLGTTEQITCNFAMDPRPEGGFWHQVKQDPLIYHRDFKTGDLIESLNVSALLSANGALTAPENTNYWMRGVFTTYGVTTDDGTTTPYMFMGESDYFDDTYNNSSNTASYLVLINLANISGRESPFVWALNLYPAQSPFFTDTPEGAAALVTYDGGPVIVSAASKSGAYFIGMH